MSEIDIMLNFDSDGDGVERINRPSCLNKLTGHVHQRNITFMWRRSLEFRITGFTEAISDTLVLLT